MAERPQPRETASLHESGGLTPEHWQFIASLKFNDPKINQYAQAKAAGLIDEEQGPFMGRRHRIEISNTAYMRTYGLAGAYRKRFKTNDFRLSSEIVEYASLTSKTTFTLDDHFANPESLPIQKSNFENPWNVVWSHDRKRWEQHGDTYVQSYDKAGADWTGYGYIADANSNHVLEAWLLTEGNIGNPVCTPPNELMRIVREEVPVSKLIERLRRKKPDYQLVVGWEKPITQTV